MYPLPLVTCIMPTAKRRDFVRRAIALFMAQEYPRKELVIIEDGEERNGDLVEGLNEVRYEYIGEQRHSIGQKRNIACERARGDLIANFDDDDWHSPRRLLVQTAAMTNGARLCGVDRLVFYDVRVEEAYLYQCAHRLWLAGGTHMYERSLWAEQPFEDRLGEDTRFVDCAVRRHVPICALTDPSLYVAMLHDGNTEHRQRDQQWGGFDVTKVRAWMSA